LPALYLRGNNNIVLSQHAMMTSIKHVLEKAIPRRVGYVIALLKTRP